VAATVLVTGATGFVGLHLVERLLAAGARVVGVSKDEPDVLARRFLAGAQPAATFVCGDVRDRDLLLAISRREQADRFVHAAAITPSAEVERASPAAIVDVNLTGTVAVLEAARECRARRVILLSSSGLYGPPDAADRLVTEDAPLQISGLYSICKLAGEHIGRRYATPYGLSVIAARVGTVYGPMERPMPSRQGMSEVYALMHAAIHDTPVSVFGAGVRRDFCYADDAGEMLRPARARRHAHLGHLQCRLGRRARGAGRRRARGAAVPGLRMAIGRGSGVRGRGGASRESPRGARLLPRDPRPGLPTPLSTGHRPRRLRGLVAGARASR